MADELAARQRCLQRLGFLTQEGVVSMKGHVAAEITAGDELVVAELLFSGALLEATPEQCAALLACVVWGEKSTASAKVREDLLPLFHALRNAARHVAQVARDSGMHVDVDDYVAHFKADLMASVGAWCQGATFAEVVKLGGIFEGSVVRAFRRLEELLRQVVAACGMMGDTALGDKFEQAREKLRRDIIFAASLYL